MLEQLEHVGNIKERIILMKSVYFKQWRNRKLLKYVYLIKWEEQCLEILAYYTEGWFFQRVKMTK